MAVIALPTHLTNPQVSLIASTYYILTYSNPQCCQVGTKFQEWVWKLTWFQWNRFRVSECCPCLAASLECCWHAMSVIRQERERGGVCVKAVKWYHANWRSRRLTSYCLTDLAESRPVSVVMLASGHWLTVDWARANECGLEGGGRQEGGRNQSREGGSAVQRNFEDYLVPPRWVSRRQPTLRLTADLETEGDSCCEAATAVC